MGYAFVVEVSDDDDEHVPPLRHSREQLCENIFVTFYGKIPYTKFNGTAS
jgi:hypothetical protein